jgi:hypothetical protein
MQQLTDRAGLWSFVGTAAELAGEASPLASLADARRLARRVREGHWRLPARTLAADAGGVGGGDGGSGGGNSKQEDEDLDEEEE